MHVAIVGGGNFGTAIANIVASNGYRTLLWMRDEAQVADVAEHRENRRYLPGHKLEPLIEPTADLAFAVGDADLIFMTVPSASFRSVSAQVGALVSPGKALVSATKGIEAAGFRLMSQVLQDEIPGGLVGAISGPNLAEEIADRQFTGTVIASQHAEVCTLVQTALKNPTFRVYASQDIYGVELGGALKNIYAIVCGMAGALNVGQNTIGMLITRALAEMSRFAVVMGANPLTFLGLAGVGDLLVTCTSPLSRNYQLGYKVGQGMSLAEAADALGKLAEGVNTLTVVRNKSQEMGVYMPLVEGLHRVLHEGENITAIVRELMTGAQAVDVEFPAPNTWVAGQ